MLNIYKVCIYAYISPILVIRSAMNSRMVNVLISATGLSEAVTNWIAGHFLPSEISISD